MIQLIFAASLFHPLFVEAAPVIAYKTVEKAPVYVTQYADGAAAGDPDVGYTTLFSNAVSYTTTLWPSTNKEYSTVLAAPTQAADPAPAPAPAPAAPKQDTSSSSTPEAAAAQKSTSPDAPAAAPAATTSHSHNDQVVVVTTKVVVTTHENANNAPAAAITSAAAPAPVTTSSSSSSSSSKTTSISGPAVTMVPKYLVYSPYNNDQSCKNADTVKSDLQTLASKGVKRIRMYATDCNSLETVQPTAKALGIRIVQGLWIGTAGTQNALNQLGDLIQSVNGDWSNYDSIIVGNEDVTNGYISADTLLSLTKQVRSKLQSAGFYGDVIIAETTTAYINNPGPLCDSSFPFIGLNAHSYFAPSFSAQRAGEFISDQKNIVQGKCSRSDIWISETGYPHQGNTNGANVPSKQNQADALNAILDHTNGDCVVLAQFDDMWKEPGQYNIEQYFGMIDILV